MSKKAESLFCTPQAFYPQYKVEKGEVRSWGNPDVKAANEVAVKLSKVLDLPKRVVLDRLLTKKPFVWTRPLFRRGWRLNEEQIFDNGRDGRSLRWVHISCPGSQARSGPAHEKKDRRTRDGRPQVQSLDHRIL